MIAHVAAGVALVRVRRRSNAKVTKAIETLRTEVLAEGRALTKAQRKKNPTLVRDLAVATDNAGNREAANVANAVLPDDGSRQALLDSLGTTEVVEQTLGSVLKYREDIDAVQDDTLGRLVEEARAAASR